MTQSRMPHRVPELWPLCRCVASSAAGARVSLSLPSLSESLLVSGCEVGRPSVFSSRNLSIYRSICHKYKFAFNSGVSDQGLPKGGHYIRGNKLGRRKYGGGGGRRPWGLWGRTLGSRPVCVDPLVLWGRCVRVSKFSFQKK